MSIALTEKTACDVAAPEMAPPVIVTEKAATQVKRIIAQEQQKKEEQTGKPAEKLYLRLLVVGGGCSGFKNSLELADTVNPKFDDIFEIQGVEVVIDRRSQMYLTGATVDFHDDLNRTGFSITNPQAKSTCGCGSSFSM